MFKQTIVRTPARTLTEGITSAPELGKPDYEKALAQHAAYIDTLKACGVAVEILDADDRYPDACFVEDVAVCTPAFAMVTSPGAPTRMGEEAVITDVLGKYYDTIEHIQAPGTLEGGDVMMVGSHYYIGLSDRTNRAGADQLIAALEKHGMTGSAVEMNEMLHLKTGLAYLENNILLVAGEFTDKAEFKDFQRLEIPDHEGYAANCIRVNDFVFVPEGYPETQGKIEAAGLKVLTCDTSEFKKLDGGLSCLSLRF
ncbi:MAG: arginine deiminase family protein [Desulfobacterales bacterium]|nr:arginine deiminase family protein [Desulfobacterales bacterium]